RGFALGGVLLGGAVLGGVLLGPAPVQGQDTHLLVVVGIGGDAEYRERFLEWGTTLRTAAMERYGLPAERAVLLAEEPSMSDAISGESRRESLEAEFGALAARTGPDDRVLVVLIGHGSFRGTDANFNIPGPDLPASDLKTLLDALPTSRVAVVNTASASGPYVESLAAPGRTVITATASGGERNETQFGGFFVEAWAGDQADLDKNGAVSLLEAFQYARTETARFYEERNLILTEHALLDDDGDAEGSREPGGESSDGALAAGFTLGVPGSRAVTSDGATPIPTSADSVLTRLYRERADFEARVAELRRLRDSMDPEIYDRELEALLVDLALKNREIRAREGGE
ncbi:MAG: hypothetical protein HKN71_08990, partial [Gemmatimonadetes bacterium]|nr:hypothetical protein [Gemmatimonadota bacterium]